MASIVAAMGSDTRHASPNTVHECSPLWAVLLLTAFASVGTGVFWNAISFVAKRAYDFSQSRTLVLYLVGAIVN